MTDLRDLVQDLRAEAHRAPADIAELMRRAAGELEAVAGEADFVPQPAPIPPPDDTPGGAIAGRRRPATEQRPLGSRPNRAAAAIGSC